MPTRGAALSLTTLVFLAATSPEDWIRQGSAAYEHGNYTVALECYSRAAMHTLDPGQVAFNQGAAYYQLGQFAQAEQAYRRCLEDAVGKRRVQALYGLGNALARQGHQLSGKPAVQCLTLAVQAYRECLQVNLSEADQAACHDTLEAAAHNRSQVESLLVKKQAESTSNEKPPNGDQPGPKPPDRSPMTDPPQREPKNGKPKPSENKATPPDSSPQATTETQAGKGNLPVLLDDRDAPPLDPQQARDYLRAHLDRIHRDRANRQPPTAIGTRAVRDW